MRTAINAALLCTLGLTSAGLAFGAESAGLGASSCASSGCHGGAGDKSDQFVIWSQHDAHSRSFATLTTSRAARMAEALSISNPVASPRCVICHAPLAGASPASLGAGVDPAEGVSCVSCHDMPNNWLRGHTRADWNHADRVAAGMRDLEDLYSRANTCVACHQNIDPELVNVGRHPALIFELDGQTQDEPKHWSEHAGNVGAQAWYVGQAVALREVSWALLNGRADAAHSVPVWQGLGWLLSRAGLDYKVSALDCSAASPASLAEAVQTADLLAKRAAQGWDSRNAGVILRRLAATQADFVVPSTDRLEQACRAERLVLALDRLLSAVPASERPTGASGQLDRLFRMAQSRPDFSPPDFARELGSFAQILAGTPAQASVPRA